MAEGQRPAAWLRHVADIEGRKTLGRGVAPQALDKGEEIGMAEIAVAREANHLIADPVRRQLRRAGNAATGNAADDPRRSRQRIGDPAPGIARRLVLSGARARRNKG